MINRRLEPGLPPLGPGPRPTSPPGTQECVAVGALWSLVVRLSRLCPLLLALSLPSFPPSSSLATPYAAPVAITRPPDQLSFWPRCVWRGRPCPRPLATACVRRGAGLAPGQGEPASPPRRSAKPTWPCGPSWRPGTAPTARPATWALRCRARPAREIPAAGSAQPARPRSRCKHTSTVQFFMPAPCDPFRRHPRWMLQFIIYISTRWNRFFPPTLDTPPFGCYPFGTLLNP